MQILEISRLPVVGCGGKREMSSVQVYASCTSGTGKMITPRINNLYYHRVMGLLDRWRQKLCMHWSVVCVGKDCASHEVEWTSMVIAILFIPLYEHSMTLEGNMNELDKQVDTANMVRHLHRPCPLQNLWLKCNYSQDYIHTLEINALLLYF